MKTSIVNTKSTERAPVRWICACLAATTLYFQTNLNDPFNAPKFWILLISAAWLLGYVLSFKKIIFLYGPIKILSILLTTFVTTMLISTIFTDNSYIAIFGETQRRNGLLSYLSLSIVMLSSAIFVRVFNISRIYLVTSAIVVIFGSYAGMQTSGKDFVKWDNQYNSILGTVGNPNFAAAVMAIAGVIVFSSMFISSFNSFQRITAAVIVIALLILIVRSQARQGLVSFCLGFAVFLSIWLLDKNKKIGFMAIVLGLIISTISILGMLQIGPLEKYLYKPSVSVRGFYWRAGLNMFENNSLFGVGIDRYGAYFKQYREVQYPLSYGFNLTSTNAHNTFIQFFATGGIFVGLSYLALNLFILIKAITSLKSFTGNARLLLAGIFASWISFHAQSLISIDNLGVSVWGWVLGGAIIGLSISSSSSKNDDQKLFIGRHNQINLKRFIVSSSFSIFVTILVITLYRGEVNAFNSKAVFNLQDETSKSIFRDVQTKTINTPLIDPAYSLTSAVNLFRGGFVEEGLTEVRELYESDPRNQDALNVLATVSENFNQTQEAITYRRSMIKLDPWNAENYFALGKNYKAIGDQDNVKAMLDMILSFAPNDPIAIKAKSELAP
jgi:O-antigen ligase